ncbi:pre-mRNA-splicing factor 18-like isoform X1 [Ostrea edulis]|uniref:pre-mRNA-splicing factor 18-like isoform X1 n=1 Tax=Ostrea edulis TaxID=37623 RepID=UPI0024AFA264|nr:pre-mRNA-splicing factor 18-like isoform X1 [Ostrea edulis]
MDFKALLQSEINRKRQKIESKDVLAPNKKYFKRGDLAAKEEEEYWKKHRRVNDTQQESPVKEDTTKSEVQEQSEEKIPQLARKEVVRRLRDRNEPIRLFGESDYEAYLRLKRLETDEPEAREEGFRNEFKAAMDKVDEDYFKEMVEAATSGEGGKRSNDVSIKDDGTTLEDIPTMKEEIGKGDSDKNSDIILRFLKYLLKMWGQSLNQRTEDEKRTLKGKEASAIHSQTVSYLKPLFKDLKHKVKYLKPLFKDLKHKVKYLKPLFKDLKHKVKYLKPLFKDLKHKVKYLKPLFKDLKHKTIDEDILDAMVIIVHHLMQRDYLKANDAYLEMAIGNAPWPIGVTMVGIHARTGREKISSRHIAHVLNDETQRKYIQALKRLMTQCQKIFPTDPSFSVNYEKPDA